MNSVRLRLPPTIHALLTAPRALCRVHVPTYTYTSLQTRLSSTSRSLPKIAQASLWQSMIPKFLRNRRSGDAASKPVSPKSKEWNPASFYIIIFILIGSQAIRMIALKNEYSAYTRSTDAKIRLLREVIEKVKNGEKVDVEKLLGTGDEAKEREWDEVLREIEREDSLWHQKQSDAEAKLAEQEAEQKKTQAETSKSIAEPAVRDESTTNDAASKRKVNFF